MKRIFTSFLFLTMCVLMGFAQTLKLNGVDQYMSIPNDAAFFPTKGGDYTVMLKVKLENYLDNNARFIGARTYTGSTSNSTTTGYELWGGKSAEQFYSVNASLEGSPWGHGHGWATCADGLNRFVHLAYVIHGSSNMSAIYVDGKFGGSHPNDAAFGTTSWGNHGKEILVGAGWKEAKSGDAITGESFVDFFTKGEIDDVRFYSRALTMEEIKADMTAEFPNREGLVAGYNFTGVTDNVVFDQSGNKHNGTLHGFEVAPVECTISIARPSEQGRMNVLNAAGQIVCAGDAVPAGTEVTLVATPANGYELDYFTANGEAIEGDKYVVNGDVEFAAVFKEKQEATYLVRLGDVPEQGYITMKYADTGKTLYGGTQVAKGTNVQLIANPFDAEAYTLDYFTANDEKFEGDIYEVQGDVVFNVVFKLKAQKPSEPTYAIPQGDNNIRAKEDGTIRFSDRLLHTVTVNGATLNGAPVEFTSTINEPGARQENVYVDKTAETVDMTAGDNIQLTFTHDIIWMHSYLYIDYDHDGVFNEENELVAYSFFSEYDTPDGLNSVNEAKKHDCGIDIPAFVVANVDKDVTTRMRLKIDWNSKNPVGNPKQSIGSNAGTIVDFTANVHVATVAPVQKFAVTVQEPYMTDGFFTVMNGETEVKGENVMIEKGTVLTLSSVAAEGKELVAYQVNGTDIEGNTVTVDQDMVLSAKFARKQVVADKYKVTFSCNTEAGTMSVSARFDGNVYDNVYSGDRVDSNSDLIITLIPQEGKTFQAMINGVDRSSEFELKPGMSGYFPDSYELTILRPQGDQDIKVEFKDPEAPQPSGKITLTYGVTPAEGGSILVRDASAHVIESGSEIVKGTENTLVTISVNKGYEIKSVLINNVESKDLFNEVMTGTFSYYISVLNENTDIQVEFGQEAAELFTVNYTVSEGGSLNFLVNGEDVKLENGAQLAANTALTLEMIPDAGNQLTKLVVNGEDKTEACDYNFIFDNYTYSIGQVKGNLDIEVSFLDETGIGEVVLSEVAYNAAAATIFVPAGAHAVVYNAAGQLVLNVAGGQTVSTAALAEGAYILHVTADHAVKVVKFIKK